MTAKTTTTPQAAPAPAAPKAPKKLNVGLLRQLVADVEEHNGPLAREGLIERLKRDQKLRISDRGHTKEYAMAGVTSSCTYGDAGGLANWCSAARRKILEAEAA